MSKKSERKRFATGPASGPASVVRTQAEYKQREFDEKAKELVWQLTEGGGSKNIHVLQTLRELEWAYIVCAAYSVAAKDADPD